MVAKKTRFSGFKTASGASIGKRATKILACEFCNFMQIYKKAEGLNTGSTCPRCACKTLRVFDSKAEASYAGELRLMAKTGKIKNIMYQVPFDLHAPDLANPNKPIFLYKYIADFTYEDVNGGFHVIDVKGKAISPEAKMKIAHAEAEYNIDIELVVR